SSVCCRQSSVCCRRSSVEVRRSPDPPLTLRLTTDDLRLTTDDLRLTTDDLRLTTDDLRLMTVRPSQLQILPQPARVRAADRDLRRLLVLHLQDVIPAEPRHDLPDLVDVHQVRAVYPPEHRRVEPLVQLVQRPVVRRSHVLSCHYRNAFVG